MKKVLFYLFVMCSLVVTSCSSDDDDNFVEVIELNFNQAHYSLAKGEIELRLISDQPASATVSIPVLFSGTAVEGTDFTADKSITLKAGETEAVLKVKRIEENIGEDDKELVVNLGTAPTGFKVGVGSYTSVELLGTTGVIMSFDDVSGILTEATSYGITLETMTGAVYKVSEETRFDIEVDPSSTAVEGTHFSFDGGKYATVLKNKNKGTVSVKFLKKEEGKDKLVLRLVERDGYAYGNNASIIITISGPYILTGTWAFDKISNLTFYQNMWGEDITKFPTGTSADQIKFEGNSYQEYTFIPTLSGELKNYFGTESCTVTYKEELEKTIEEESTRYQVTAKIAVLQFPSVNVNFSANNTSNRAAVVGFRIIKSDGKDILECTIDDFEPTDFMTDTYDMMKNYGEDPIMKSAPLRLHFTRVK